MVTYLYKKTHNITGLNYLGKTVSSNPHKYKGSGVYWKKHIKKHGYNVSTEILKECKTQEELVTWGKYYSDLWNVVESDEWANLKSESGDGGDTSNTENYILKRHKFSHCGPDNPGYKHGLATKQYKEEQKILRGGKGKHLNPMSEEQWKICYANISPYFGKDNNSGKKYYNDGIKNYLTKVPPDGCVPGKLQKQPKTSNAGKTWFNNGVKNAFSVECPIGYVVGQLKLAGLKECEHCHKSVDPANFARSHGNRCKIGPSSNQS